jgi:Na+/H+ antiporter NhaC
MVARPAHLNLYWSGCTRPSSTSNTISRPASPISDTTVVASIALATDHVGHVHTQLPYAHACCWNPAELQPLVIVVSRILEGGESGRC